MRAVVVRAIAGGLMAWVLAGPAVALAAEAAAPPAAAASAAQPAPARLPAELFMRHPDFGDAALSPSGRQLAVTVNVRQHLALVVFDLEQDRIPVVAASYTDADILDFSWVGDAQLVYRVRDLQAGSGDQRFAPGLFAVDADGRGQQQLIDHRWEWLRPAAGAARRQPLSYRHSLLGVPTGGGTEVIVGHWSFDAQRDVRDIVPLRLDIATGRTRPAAQNLPEGIIRWWFDPRGEPRVGASLHEGRWRILWRAPGTQSWRELAVLDGNRLSWFPSEVGDKGELYVNVWAGVDGGSELRRFDFERNAPATEPLVRAPGFDIRGGFVYDEAGVLLGVRVETDAETTAWFHPQLKAWQQLADQRLRGRINQLDCRRCFGDDPVVLVRSWSDQHPGELWLLRPRRGAGEWTPVGPARRDVNPAQMATLDFHRVVTRDGLSMPVWLTLPRGSKAGTPRPAVLLVHGGPWLRGGHWRWNDQAQFLASRGWVVIEPEFRGSTGYGDRWFVAGHKQWGRAMQDDLVDAVQWAVKQGWVDERRVCIAGASYGGYAALMAPLRHPGVFRCAASWVGVTDPRALMDLSDAWQDFSDETRRYTLPERVGDPKTDSALLDEATPLLHAKRLTLPIMLTYGTQDRRVPLAQGEAMRRALIEAGNPPQWWVYGDEAHGWLKPENRIDFAQRLERFLSRHLDVPAEAAAR